MHDLDKSAGTSAQTAATGKVGSVGAVLRRWSLKKWTTTLRNDRCALSVKLVDFPHQLAKTGGAPLNPLAGLGAAPFVSLRMWFTLNLLFEPIPSSLTIFIDISANPCDNFCLLCEPAVLAAAMKRVRALLGACH